MAERQTSDPNRGGERRQAPQYNEVMAAFRRMIPSPALRMAFSNQVDGYLRQYALGVWQGGRTKPASLSLTTPSTAAKSSSSRVSWSANRRAREVPFIRSYWRRSWKKAGGWKRS